MNERMNERLGSWETSAQPAGSICTSSRHDFYAGSETELMKECFAIFPSQTKRAYISHAKAGDHCGHGLRVTFAEFAIHQGAFRPVYQLRKRQFVVQVRGDLVGDGLFRDRHG